MTYKRVLASSILALLSTQVIAGVTYKDGDKYLKVGGRIHIQYHQQDPDNGQSTDDVFFRRLRPYIEGSIHPQWKGKFQWDLGSSTGDNEVSVKDAYMQYSGFNNMNITIGNRLFPFSRKGLTSSKYQQFVERTFVGDHNYGTPGRQIGIYVDSYSNDKKFDWNIGLADGRIDPDDDKIDFDSAANDQTDWNEGIMVGARMSYHPFGALKLSQGDFSGEQKATLSVGLISWNNDDDNNTYTDTLGLDNSDALKPDLNSVTGIELSAAYRNAGFSVDLQYNKFNAETIDQTVSSGIYVNGETDLDNISLDAGYMLIPAKMEVVAAISSQDADGYNDQWNRIEVGINWFVHKHDIKYQLTYRNNENVKGKKGSDEDEIFLQAQYVF